MTRTYVGEERKAHCTTCEDTTDQYVYHSGEWVCVDCGNEVPEK